MTGQNDRRRPISAAQWLAARALSEGAPPTRKRVAAILGCDDSAVYARAALEGWKTPDFRRPVVRDSYGDFMQLAFGPSAGSGQAPSASSDSGGPDSSGQDSAGAGEGAGENAAGSGQAPLADADTDNSGSGTGMAPEADWADDDDYPSSFARPVGADDGAGLPAGAADDPVAMLARGTALVAHRLGLLISRGEKGGRLHKAEIDNLAAMARMMERWETLAKERAKQEETQSDEELAKTLREINEKIVELAEEEARRLVAAGYGREEGDADD